MSDQLDELPIGILRLREQWRAEGLLPLDASARLDGDLAPDEYALTEDQVLAVLGITARELYSLVSEGELDCVVPDPLAPAPAGRRMFKEEDVKRFLKKCQQRAALRQIVTPDKSRDAEPSASEGDSERDGWRHTLLLELRNLKEQQRDLTSFVYELARELRNGRKPNHNRPKRRWYLLWLR